MQLNVHQKKAVHTLEGRVLVLAGAGSGKTRVIIHRIVTLIEANIPPSQILGLTFTNKAAAEMRERLKKMISPHLAKQVHLSTFHSFCMQILRKEIHHLGYGKNFTLYDEQDMTRLAKHLTRDILKKEGDIPSIASSLQKIQQAHNDESTQHLKDDFTTQLHDRLQQSLRSYNAVNFDHLIALTLKLFREFPEILEKYQEKYRYIMIDEYQDTNLAQFQLAEILCKKYRNLCVVGDDDQSIYAFRGAKVDNILEFSADHVIKLEENYRSTKKILQTANAVIAKNEDRHGKKLWTRNQEDYPIYLFHTPDEEKEAQTIIQRILHMKEHKNLHWSDFAILYRSNALSRNFEMALMQASWKSQDGWRKGIPYEIFGGLEFSQRSEIKDIFAFLRVMTNSKDEEALLRIINVPRRGISDKSLEKLTQYQRKNKLSLWNVLQKTTKDNFLLLPPRTHQSIQNFVGLIEKTKQKFQKNSLSSCLKEFIHEVHYAKAIEEETKKDKLKQFKWENVQECIHLLMEYEKQTPNGTLEDFLANCTLNKTSPITTKNRQDAVQLMTFHSAKGLEFPVCFLVGLEDHILPHEKSIKDSPISEERRLFYVAITRAQKYLTLSMAQSRMYYGKKRKTQPSRFLFDIPKDLLQMVSYKDYIHLH